MGMVESTPKGGVFFQCIANLTALRTLNLSHIENFEKKTLLNHLRLKRWKKVIEEKRLIPGLMHLSHHTYLYKVILEGKLELPAKIGLYPPNLLELSLDRCELKNDPMFILKKLPKLKVLSYLWTHMLERNWSALLEDSFNSKAQNFVVYSHQRN